MTEAAKIKAGIPTKKRTKAPTKNDQIRELQARLAAFEHPDETAALSKEPLFMRDSVIISPFTPFHFLYLTPHHH
ncbi:hypothetical protein BJ322DRAFT_1113033 [Thelephora terrestris]|uniref:Uncharacterized protein n=1 Tax=Thelephora terrestris TaxID=56493 RepID=A0A9P6L2H3_9AGAM|nr:hypothetical protein BJ322DRAFT_1113033 [Thelephora terrestris]